MRSTSAGSKVGVTVYGKDDDGRNNLMEYSLLDTAQGKFTIDKYTGVITVAEGANFASIAPFYVVESRALTAHGSYQDKMHFISTSPPQDQNLVFQGVLKSARGSVLQGGTGNDLFELSSNETWGLGYRAINTGDIHTTGIGTGESISIWGKTKFTDVLSGGRNGGSGNFDTDILALTDQDDVFFLHDTFSSISGNVPTVKDFMRRDVGNDKIFGGKGNDVMSGGDGRDLFQFTQTAGSDVIKDFDAKDKTDLWGRRTEDSDKLTKSAINETVNSNTTTLEWGDVNIILETNTHFSIDSDIFFKLI